MPSFPPSDKNAEGGMLLESPEQGQAKNEFTLGAADTPLQDLLRSYVTGDTRSQEMDPRCKRGSNPLQNPGGL